MHHGLFVPRHVKRQDGGPVQERLANPRDVSVTEDAEHAGKEVVLAPVTGDLLTAKKSDERLCDREPLGLHHHPPFAATNDSTSGSVGMKLAQP